MRVPLASASPSALGLDSKALDRLDPQRVAARDDTARLDRVSNLVHTAIA